MLIPALDSLFNHIIIKDKSKPVQINCVEQFSFHARKDNTGNDYNGPAFPCNEKFSPPCYSISKLTRIGEVTFEMEISIRDRGRFS